MSHHSHINGHQVSLSDYFRTLVQDVSFVMTNDDDALEKFEGEEDEEKVQEVSTN